MERGKSPDLHAKRPIDNATALPTDAASPELRNRMRGALIGLAVGDAVGTTVEFRSTGTFPVVTDMVGGGPFHLSAGE